MNLSAFHRQPHTSPVATVGGQIPSPVGRCSADAAECFLEWLPQAVVLVDSRGAVGGFNERAAAIVTQEDGLMIRHGILRCARPADTAVLHRLIAAVALRNGEGGGRARCALRIHRPVGRRPLAALVTGLRRNSGLKSGEAVIAVLVNDPEEAPALEPEMLRSWYDLTPAEARVAMLLAAGLSLDEIVEHLGVGTNTARTHLKSIFSKTETRRQGELIRLLLSNPTLGTGPEQSNHSSCFSSKWMMTRFGVVRYRAEPRGSCSE